MPLLSLPGFRLRIRLFLCLTALLLSVPPSAAPLLADTGIAKEITAAQLRDYLYFVASDEMEGRDTPSRGLDTTAKFLATLLSRWGVKPGGEEGTYFQKIMLRADRLTPEECSAALNDQKFAYGQDYFVPAGLGAGGGSVNAPVVYAGDGWLLKSQGRDALKGLDVQGKIVVIRNYGSRLPKGVSEETLRQGKEGEDWERPAEYARKRGAVGIVFLLSREEMREWDRLRRSLQGSPVPRPERLSGSREPEDRPRLPAILINEAMARALFAGERADADSILQENPPEGFALSADKRLSFNAALRIERTPTSNVIAIVEGSDPKLKSEYVALSCHYDHVGVSRRQTASDRIFNGADDNGSGTVTLLAVAEAMAKAKKRPKRSFLFIWHTGEEKGLWGSQYFTRYPTVPLDKITALINIDMIGRSRKPDDNNPRNRDLSGPDEVYVIGATLMSSELERLCKSVNDGYLKLRYNYRYDDPKDPERFFFRSDHFYYAQKGIPALFYFNGVHEDYHGVGDEPQKIDYARMEKIARTIFRTLWELAQAKSRPKVDKKLPPELTGGG